VNLESWAANEPRARKSLRLDASVDAKGAIADWKVESSAESNLLASPAKADEKFKIALLRNFEFKLPLDWLLAVPPGSPSSSEKNPAAAAANKLRLRFSLWQSRLPVDALPPEGWIELPLLSEAEMDAYGT
jgi:hypothetical protein